MAIHQDTEPMDRREEERVNEEAGFQRRERIVQDVAAARSQRAYWVSGLVWLIVGFVESVIGLRILLKLIGANPQNPFADFIYGVAAFFLEPFFGLTSMPAVDGKVLEIPSLIALIVYLLAGWGLTRLIWLVLSRPSARIVSIQERYKPTEK